MTRWPPGTDHHEIETHVTGGVLPAVGDENFGGAFDADALARCQEFAIAAVAPRLDLNHGKDVAAAGDDVDLAHSSVESACENRITAQPQPPYTQGFGESPEAVSAAARP